MNTPLPLPLPIAWVEKIFRKLTLIYGREFTGRWEGLETADVIDDWAQELAGFEKTPDAIGYALQHLPVGKPPTALEFRDICRRAPRPALPALPEPQADPERVATELAKLTQPAPAYDVFTDWIGRGMARLASGEKVSPMVARCIREAAMAKGVA